MFKVDRCELSNSAHRAELEQFFESCPNAFIQQSPYWADVIADPDKETPYYLVARDSGAILAALPLYLFEGPQGALLSSVPDVGPLGGIFFSPLCHSNQKVEIAKELIERSGDLGTEKKCIGLTIISNPFEPDRNLYAQFMGADIEFENFTQVIPLSALVTPEGEVKLPCLQKRTYVRRRLSKAQKSGFSVKDCENLNELEQFFRLSEKRHGELGAKGIAFETLRRIFEILVPRKKAKFIHVYQGDKLASAGVHVGHGHVVDILRLVQDSELAELYPNFINTHESILWAIKEGYRYYNWQSSPDRLGGVYRHKKEWGAEEMGYSFFSRLLAGKQRVLDIGEERLRAEYPFRFVVPYAGFADDFAQSVYRKN